MVTFYEKLSDEYLPVRKAQTVYGSISGNYAFRGEKPFGLNRPLSVISYLSKNLITM